MFKFLVVSLLLSAAILQTSDAFFGDMNGEKPPLIVERNGKPYVIGLFSRYEDGKPIYTYFNDEVCEWMHKVTGETVSCEPLPEEEQTEKSKFQIPIYQGF